MRIMIMQRALKSINIVGIIVARLKDKQNVNLEIKSNVTQMFLNINNIDYQVYIQHIKKEKYLTFGTDALTQANCLVRFFGEVET